MGPTALPELEEVIRAVIEMTTGLPSVMISLTFPAHTDLPSAPLWRVWET